MQVDGIPLDEFVQFILIDGDDSVDHFAHVANRLDRGHAVLGVPPVAGPPLVVQPGTAATPTATAVAFHSRAPACGSTNCQHLRGQSQTLAPYVSIIWSQTKNTQMAELNSTELEKHNTHGQKKNTKKKKKKKNLGIFWQTAVF